jgi:two-component system, cell cycle sensor histidine kinase and response regulator CckA
LPRAAREELPSRSGVAEGSSGSSAASRAIVLLAEDEPLVRGVTARALTGAGYQVIQAEHGEQALDLARQHDAPIDILVTDIVMPGMGGVELAERLVSERPGLRVLFVTGYSRQPIPEAGPLTGLHALLPKPYTPGELVAEVARLLQAEAPHPPIAAHGDRGEEPQSSEAVPPPKR